MIVVDILLAFSLAAIFAALIFESSTLLRNVFEQARERNELMDLYEAHKDYFVNMIPYESRHLSIPVASSTVEIIGQARWYGNDRVETEININGKLSFKSVRSYPKMSEIDTRGTSVCSADFNRQGTLTITQIALPVDPLLPLTDLEVRNSVAYISTDSTRAGDPDIIVVDISDTTHPSIVSFLNTGPGITTFSLVGKWIFTAAASTAGQLHAIRIDSLNQLVLERKYTLPLPSTTTSPTMASSIFYADNQLYLGTEKWDGAEFIVFDTSNPAQLVQQGSLEIGSKVTDIFVRNGIAYSTTAAQQQLIVTDITDPFHLVPQNSFSPAGWSRQEGKHIYFFEDRLSFGRTSGGFDIKTEHELFTWATSSAQDLASLTSFNVSGGVYASVADRSGVYIVTRSAGHELQKFGFDVSQGPVATYSLPVAPQTLVCDNERLYVLAHSAPFIYEISFK